MASLLTCAPQAQNTTARAGASAADTPPAHLWLLIPVKPFAESKSRLAGVLDPAERAALSRQLLHDVIVHSRRSGLFRHILVITRDAAAQRLAAQLGAETLTETVAEAIPSSVPAEPRATPEAGLNQALEAGRDHALAHGAQAILVLPADLPLLAPQDLGALAAPLAHASPGAPAQVILARSHDGGTNALLMRPPHAIDFAFGPQSFARHKALAQAAGCVVTEVHSPALAYDLDLPEDLWGEDLGI